MHWTAGFGLCFMSHVIGPPPVMSIVSRGDDDMNAPFAMKCCRTAGRGVLICSLLVWIGGCVTLSVQDTHDPTYNPSWPESMTLHTATWWPRILVWGGLGVIAGCILLWAASSIESLSKGAAK